MIRKEIKYDLSRDIDELLRAKDPFKRGPRVDNHNRGYVKSSTRHGGRK
jgi:hypothetical protein